MIPRYRKSIATKLTLMNLLVSGAALLLACTGFFAYDQVTFRQQLVRTLSAQAQIIGSNSVSALLFNDPQAELTTLSALRSFPHIVSGGILTVDRQPFAQYNRDPGEQILTLPAMSENQFQTYTFGNTHLVLVRKIVSDEKLVGFVYLRADLTEVSGRLRLYSVIAIAVLLLSLLFALLVSSAFRKSVAQPIAELAETARRVSRDRDYSVRVPPTGEQDEVAVLIDAFNEMLREIQQRDRALLRAQNDLEQRVSDRTHELVSANQELEAFSYSVSHDLRGPLDLLNGFSYLLQKNNSSQLDEAGKESLASIRKASRRMAELIDDLLNLSRLTTSSMHREAVDLSDYARSIMEELCREAPERQVEFITPQRAQGHADPRLLRILMDNLLRNAWKYTSHHERARIEFGVQVKPDRTVFFVKDDGSGFDQRSADRLFQPFQRLHSPEEFPGSGIGLATVRRIVQRHGGEVWAEGEVERGATFHFTLEPRRRSRAPEKEA